MAVAARRNVSENLVKKFRISEVGRPKGMGFEEMLEEFKSSRLSGKFGATKPCRPKTVISYHKDLKLFVAYLAQKGFKYWNEVPEKAVEQYIDALQQNKEYQQATSSHHLRTLKAFFNWINADPSCVRLQMVGYGSLIPRIPKGKQKIWIPTPEVMKRFWEGFKSSGMMWDFRDFVVTALMLDCGARSGEIRFLKLGHLRLDADTVLLPEEGKTGARPVNVKTETKALIEQWLSVRSRSNPKEDYVFLNKWGGQLRESALPQSFERNRQRLKIDEELTPHTVRHFFATYYLINGGSLPNLKIIMGHMSFETLKIYINLAAQMSSVKEEHSRVSPMAMLSDYAGTTAAKPKRRRNIY